MGLRAPYLSFSSLVLYVGSCRRTCCLDVLLFRTCQLPLRWGLERAPRFAYIFRRVGGVLLSVLPLPPTLSAGDCLALLVLALGPPSDERADGSCGAILVSRCLLLAFAAFQWVPLPGPPFLRVGFAPLGSCSCGLGYCCTAWASLVIASSLSCGAATFLADSSAGVEDHTFPCLLLSLCPVSLSLSRLPLLSAAEGAMVGDRSPGLGFPSLVLGWSPRCSCRRHLFLRACVAVPGLLPPPLGPVRLASLGARLLGAGSEVGVAAFDVPSFVPRCSLWLPVSPFRAPLWRYGILLLRC